MSASETPPSLPLWLQASAEEMGQHDLDAPVSTVKVANVHALSTAFQRAAEMERADPQERASGRRVFAMLSAAMSMHQKSGEGRQPFGAVMATGDRRTAIPEDFRGAPLAALLRAAERVQHPVVRARLCDLSWLLVRQRADLGRAAISAYLAIAQQLQTGDLSQFEGVPGEALCPAVWNTLSRALEIGWATGWEQEESQAARMRVNELRKLAIERGRRGAIHRMSEIDLRFGVSDPAEVAAGLESFAGGSADALESSETWALAARAYAKAKNSESRNACLRLSAEALAAQAEKLLVQQRSAMTAAHFQSQAIAKLHGVPGAKELRAKWRHRLIDMQAGIPDEMSPFSQPMDLREIIQQVETAIGRLGLRDLLFFFADMTRSPEPAVLLENARSSLEQFPLASVFGSAHHDDEGKVIHRTAGGDYGDTASSALHQHIAQAESIRRQIFAAGQIEVVRQNLNSKFFLSTDVFRALLRHSPFVPDDLLETYSRGFARFFRGRLHQRPAHPRPDARELASLHPTSQWVRRDDLR